MANLAYLCNLFAFLSFQSSCIAPTFLKPSQHFFSLSVFFHPETAQQDPCLRAQPRLTPATEFYNKRQQLGKCFFLVELEGNLTLDGREQRGGTVWADGVGDEIALLTDPISPSFPLGLTVLFLSGWCNCFMTDWARIYPWPRTKYS